MRQITEREGFEPSMTFQSYRRSRSTPSTTRTSLLSVSKVFNSIIPGQKLQFYDKFLFLSKKRVFPQNEILGKRKR